MAKSSMVLRTQVGTALVNAGGVDQGEPAGVPGLPCLISNNSIMPPGGMASKCLSVQHRKAATALGWNVSAMADKHGLHALGFLTLTFSDHVLCASEAQRRFNSLATNVLGRYLDWIGVLERQKSGRIHYHLVVAVKADIRTGFDFESVDSHDYSSASQAIRSEWAFWRRTSKSYGFGRTELLPVRSTQEAVARYVGKYIAKHMEARNPADKGVRLVKYSAGARVATTRYSWATEGALEWRRKVALFAHVAYQSGFLDEPSYDALSRNLGARWAYNHRKLILSMPSMPVV